MTKRRRMGGVRCLLCMLFLGCLGPGALWAQADDSGVLKDPPPRDDNGNVIAPGKHSDGLPAGPDALPPGEEPDGPPSTPQPDEAEKNDTHTLADLLKPIKKPEAATEVPTAEPTLVATAVPKKVAKSETKAEEVAATPPQVQSISRDQLGQSEEAGKRGDRDRVLKQSKLKSALKEAGIAETFDLYWWVVVSGFLILSLMMLLGYWSFLRPYLKRIEYGLQKIQGLSWEQVDGGVERLSEASASRLLGLEAAPLLVLPSHGLSLAVVPKEQLQEIVDLLAAQALMALPGDVALVTVRNDKEQAAAALRQVSPGSLSEAASRFVLISGRGRSLQSLARIAQNMLRPGQSVMILEHPRWLHDLDGASRSSWVLARIEQRLALIAASTGTAVWVILRQSHLAPRVGDNIEESEFLVSLMTLQKAPEGGLTRSGTVSGKFVSDRWEG